ncbi:Sensory/regulatory protein RpfC [compost metagenome]
MIKRIMIVCISSLLLFLFIPVSGMLDQDRKTNDLQVINGVMDLSKWDYEHNERIKLDGDWEFYWDQLLTPEQFREKGADKPALSAYIQVPSLWNGEKVNGQSLPAYGSATYRVLLKNVPHSGIFALKKTNIRFSSTIYVNGQKLIEDGLPSKDAADYKASNYSELAFFSYEKGDIEIIVHAANYDYTNAGIPVSIYFGEQAAMQEHQQRSMSYGMSICAILASLALIYLICFVMAGRYGKRDYTLLLITGISLFYALYNGLIGDRVLQSFFPDMSFELMYKLKDISSIVAFILLTVFFYILNKNIISLKFTQLAIVLQAIYMVMVALLPIRIYTTCSFFILFLNGLILVWLLYRVVVQYIVSEANEWYKNFLLFLAILTINLYSLDVMLFAFFTKSSLWPSHFYIMMFNFILVLLITYRFVEDYQAINKMKNQLVQLDKIKDEFLSNTSHELKTPLNAIVNITDTLLKGAEGPVTDQQARNLAIVKDNGRRLTHLVNELLDYSKMKHGDITFYKSSIDLKSTVDSVVQLHSFLLENKRIILINSILDNFPEVYADGNRLLQIMHNLIGNAIKFTHHGKVEILSEIVDGMAHIQVIDSGIGIQPDMMERIFMPFEQADDMVNRSEGGTGIGLSITKKLVELHGGGLYVKSAPGEGSTFSFTIPLSGLDRVSNKAITQVLETDYQIKHGNAPVQYPHYVPGKLDEPILVVDDNYSNLQTITNLLKLEGYPLVVVNRGQLALDELTTSTGFFLVILDISMPDMSGYEVLHRIRERFSPFELPVLMLTAKNRASEIAIAIENGANDFVGKPFEAEELMARVRSLTKLKASVKGARDSEIAFLRSQINPHFLYNALNAIAELCVADADQAEELTLQLSKYLRSSFDFKQLDSLTGLKNELELVQAYLQIEKARFGNRLAVEFDVDDGLDIRIPPLVLQPLVENAIRHGLMSNLRGGLVKISIKQMKNGEVSFVVEDNGCGIGEAKLEMLLEPDVDDKGVGLWNISQRIKLLYDRDIYVESEKDVGTKVSFVIPAASTKH